MSFLAHKLNATLREAEQQGGWSSYAVWCLGEADSGDRELDIAITELYTANENVHRLANKLALRYNLDMFNGH